jgi:hypothetical protein
VLLPAEFYEPNVINHQIYKACENYNRPEPYKHQNLFESLFEFGLFVSI